MQDKGLRVADIHTSKESREKKVCIIEHNFDTGLQTTFKYRSSCGK